MEEQPHVLAEEPAMAMEVDDEPHGLGPMSLTEEEEELAADIKAAVELDPEIKKLSDFLYAQFAIFALAQPDPPTLSDLVYQVQGFNQFKEDHNIQDTQQDAMAATTHFVRHLLPGYILSCQFGETTSVVVDAGRFDLAQLSDSQFLSEWLAGIFYMSHASTRDFRTIRNGLHFFQECEGFSPPASLLFKLNPLRKWADLGAYYPMRFASYSMYHTNSLMNLVVSASRSLLPSFVHESFQVGCEMEGRLSDVLLVPTMEAANDRIMSNLEGAFRERYAIEAKFSLESMSV